MENMICDKRENFEELIPYIDKPIYIKGYCWGKTFDGWTVIYEVDRESWLGKRNLLFDYKGETYPTYGFLPSRYTMWTDSTYNNAFYIKEIN